MEIFDFSYTNGFKASQFRQTDFLRHTSLFALLTIIVLAGLGTAHAQAVSRYDVFGGYSYLRFDSRSYGFSDYSNLNGGNLAGAFNITKTFSGVADISATFGHDERVYTFMAGPQASIQKFGGRWFAQALFGKARNAADIPTVASSLGRSFAFGGGYDIAYRKRFSIRVFQADYVNTSSYGATQTNVRVSAGLVFHLGKNLK
jgi:hypothetical protein